MSGIWTPDSHREGERREKAQARLAELRASWPWHFEGACSNCGHDESFHDWGGGGMTNLSFMYCKFDSCDCGYTDGSDDPVENGWSGGKASA